MRRLLPVVMVVVGAAAGCGGGPRQDADEPRGTWRVNVVQASFPSAQHVSRTVQMRIRVRNEERTAIPNLAVTVLSFTARSNEPGLADPNRPVWIIDRPPIGGETAYVSTWALGRVPPGGEKEFVWRLTPVQPGPRTLTYKIAAGLDGKARARLTSGAPAQGRFRVNVSDKPAQAGVDPNTGAVTGH